MPKNTPRGTSARLDLALRHRRVPRPAAQNVAQKASQIAPGRPPDATRFAKAMAACPKRGPKCGVLKTLRGFATLHSALRDRRVPRHGPKRDPNCSPNRTMPTRGRHAIGESNGRVTKNLLQNAVRLIALDCTSLACANRHSIHKSKYRETGRILIQSMFFRMISR